MKAETSKEKLYPKAEIVPLLIFVAFVCGGILYQMSLSNTWTCEQAKQAWQKNNSTAGGKSLQQLDPAIANRDTLSICR
jgi:archaellum component FlaF (FlaF/FlaG flagellin family)